MRGWMCALALAMGLAGPALGADARSLRSLEAPPPATVAPLPADAKVRPVKLTRALMQPPQGEAWALIYTYAAVAILRPPTVPDRLLEWSDGPSSSDTPAFARIFDEELKAAGFRNAGETSLFEEQASTDLQVGVAIDDVKARFCRDCPHILQQDPVAAVVTMKARWEVYSALRGEVVARIPTQAGSTWRKPMQGGTGAVMFDAFRENVRALLASEAFRAAVTGADAPPAKPVLTPLTFAAAPSGKRPLASSASAVAAILTGEGHGTGFLVSRDGYLLTNHHVVGGAKYVKVRWSDGMETIGEVVRADRRRDIALVKADAGARQPLALRAAQAALGEPVYAVGTPLNTRLQGSVSRGIVSAAARTYDGQTYIQSDVVINGGNSGGPLLDESGAVIGICVSGMDIGGTPVGVNFFIPINEALSVLALAPAL